MFLSDFLKNGVTLACQAGLSAINANDLLEINQFGQLYPVSCSDNAAVGNVGATPIAKTTVTAYVPGGTSTPAGTSTLHEVMASSVDNSVFMAAPYLVTNQGVQIYKYSTAGALQGSLILSAATTTPSYISVFELTGHNIVVLWSMGGTDVHFAIVDQALNIIQTDTTVVGASVTTNLTGIALAAGGFAISYGLAAGIYRAIYTAVGGVTLAPTLIAGSPVVAAAVVAIAQLSSGDLVVAMRQPNGTANFLSHCIVSSVGAGVVLATTNLNATTSAAPYSFGPFISVLTGFYCIGASESVDRGVAYVLNNAGALQGAPFNAGTFGGVLTGLQVGGQGVALVNDGAAFWFLCSGQSGAGAIIYMPTTGTGFVASVVYSMTNMSAVFDHGLIVVFTYSGDLLQVYQPTGTGRVLLVASTSMAGNVSGTPPSMFAVGDFCVLMGTNIAASAFSVTKYSNTAIVGVAQQALAAGNAGTLVNYSHGGGAGKNGYPTNAMLGTVGKGFDHSSTNLVGNKGTMLGNSVALEGIV